MYTYTLYYLENIRESCSLYFIKKKKTEEDNYTIIFVKTRCKFLVYILREKRKRRMQDKSFSNMYLMESIILRKYIP